MATGTLLAEPKQVKQHISYGKNEAPKLLKMEKVLMEYFGYNRSQLHKSLLRDAYSKMSLIWVFNSPIL